MYPPTPDIKESLASLRQWWHEGDNRLLFSQFWLAEVRPRVEAWPSRGCCGERVGGASSLLCPPLGTR